MINQLIKEIKKKDAPIVVGLDPMLSYVPEQILADAFDACGQTPEGAAEAIWQFARAGKTVLLVSHNRDEVYRLADKVAILRDGQIERLGTRDEVFRDPGTRTACILTGCKNVSAIRRLDDGHAEALDSA